MLHPSLTAYVIVAAAERRLSKLDSPGCILCGEEHGGIEPDACGYPCEGCGDLTVYCVEELLMGLPL